MRSASSDGVRRGERLGGEWIGTQDREEVGQQGR